MIVQIVTMSRIGALAKTQAPGYEGKLESCRILLLN
jgi:hypothetical protein